MLQANEMIRKNQGAGHSQSASPIKSPSWSSRSGSRGQGFGTNKDASAASGRSNSPKSSYTSRHQQQQVSLQQRQHSSDTWRFSDISPSAAAPAAAMRTAFPHTQSTPKSQQLLLVQRLRSSQEERASLDEQQCDPLGMTMRRERSGTPDLARPRYEDLYKRFARAYGHKSLPISPPASARGSYSNSWAKERAAAAAAAAASPVGSPRGSAAWGKRGHPRARSATPTSGARGGNAAGVGARGAAAKIVIGTSRDAGGVVQERVAEFELRNDSGNMAVSAAAAASGLDRRRSSSALGFSRRCSSGLGREGVDKEQQQQQGGKLGRGYSARGSISAGNSPCREGPVSATDGDDRVAKADALIRGLQKQAALKAGAVAAAAANGAQYTSAWSVPAAGQASQGPSCEGRKQRMSSGRQSDAREERRSVSVAASGRWGGRLSEGYAKRAQEGRSGAASPREGAGVNRRGSFGERKGSSREQGLQHEEEGQPSCSTISLSGLLQSARRVSPAAVSGDGDDVAGVGQGWDHSMAGETSSSGHKPTLDQLYSIARISCSGGNGGSDMYSRRTSAAGVSPSIHGHHGTSSSSGGALGPTGKSAVGFGSSSSRIGNLWSPGCSVGGANAPAHARRDSANGAVSQCLDSPSPSRRRSSSRDGAEKSSSGSKLGGSPVHVMVGAGNKPKSSSSSGGPSAAFGSTAPRQTDAWMPIRVEGTLARRSSSAGARLSGAGGTRDARPKASPSSGGDLSPGLCSPYSASPHTHGARGSTASKGSLGHGRIWEGGDEDEGQAQQQQQPMVIQSSISCGKLLQGVALQRAIAELQGDTASGSSSQQHSRDSGGSELGGAGEEDDDADAIGDGEDSWMLGARIGAPSSSFDLRDYTERHRVLLSMVVEESETPDSVRSLTLRESTISLKHLISAAKKSLSSSDSRDSRPMEVNALGSCGVIDEDAAAALDGEGQGCQEAQKTAPLLTEDKVKLGAAAVPGAKDVVSADAGSPGQQLTGPRVPALSAASAMPLETAEEEAEDAVAAAKQLTAEEKATAGEHPADGLAAAAAALDSKGPFNAVQEAHSTWGPYTGLGSEQGLSRRSSAAGSTGLGARLSPPRAWRPGGSREGSRGGDKEVGQKARDYAIAVEKQKRRASSSRRNSCASGALSARGSEAGVSPSGVAALIIGGSVSRDLSRNQSISSGRASLAGSMPVSPSRDNYDKPWRTGMAVGLGSDSRSGSAGRPARGEKPWEEGELKLGGGAKAEASPAAAGAALLSVGDSLVSNSHIQQLQLMKMQLVSQLLGTTSADMQGFSGSALSSMLLEGDKSASSRNEEGTRGSGGHGSGSKAAPLTLAGGVGNISVTGGVRRGGGSNIGSGVRSAASSSGGAASESQLKLLQMLAEQAKLDEESNKGSDVFNRWVLWVLQCVACIQLGIQSECTEVELSFYRLGQMLASFGLR